MKKNGAENDQLDIKLEFQPDLDGKPTTGEVVEMLIAELDKPIYCFERTYEGFRFTKRVQRSGDSF